MVSPTEVQWSGSTGVAGKAYLKGGQSGRLLQIWEDIRKLGFSVTPRDKA